MDEIEKHLIKRRDDEIQTETQDNPFETKIQTSQLNPFKSKECVYSKEVCLIKITKNIKKEVDTDS